MTEGAFCAICQTPLAAGEAATACPSCHAEYHAECWQENGGCAVYGCPEVPTIEQQKSIEIPVSYWGQEKKPCPSCGQEILAAAVRCRHCGATFASAQPQDAEQFKQRAVLEQSLPTTRRYVVWLFVLGVLPCTAPIGGIASLIYSMTHRREIAALPSLYPALAKIGMAVGLGQTVLLVLAAMVYSVSNLR